MSKLRGMTFLELIIVLGIFGAIASTVLFNYRDFSANVHLQNLAQDIALQIKRAQTDAVSGKTPTLSTSQTPDLLNWKPSYGIAFFDTDDLRRSFLYYFNSTEDNDSGEIILDMNEGDTYTSGNCGGNSNSECLEEITINSGEVIDEICFGFLDTSSDQDCDGNGGDEAGSAYVSFTRPRANATIMEADLGSSSYRDNVYIRITSPQGGHKYITIWASGYISIR